MNPLRLALENDTGLCWPPGAFLPGDSQRQEDFACPIHAPAQLGAIEWIEAALGIPWLDPRQSDREESSPCVTRTSLCTSSSPSSTTGSPPKWRRPPAASLALPVRWDSLPLIQDWAPEGDGDA